MHAAPARRLRCLSNPRAGRCSPSPSRSHWHGLGRACGHGRPDAVCYGTRRKRKSAGDDGGGGAISGEGKRYVQQNLNVDLAMLVDMDQAQGDGQIPFTFKELAMLKALASAGSVKGAAELMYVSQSSVSSMLALLEQKMKVTLVNRHPGMAGCTFTDEGQLLLRYAERILAASMEAVRVSKCHVLSTTSTLRTGWIELDSFSISSRWLPHC